MTTISLRVPTMRSRGCVRVISARISDVTGVRTLAVNLRAKTVRVTGPADPALVVAAINEAGHAVEPLPGAGSTNGTQPTGGSPMQTMTNQAQPTSRPSKTFPTDPRGLAEATGPVRVERRGHIGLIVAGSLATGLVAVPLIPAREGNLTGAVLCGFALGWAMLAVLSVRLTDQPQRWAAAPALLMGVAGLLLAGFGSSVQPVLSWV